MPASREAEDEAETLLLEVQRSLDYYQHELAQRPAAHLVLAPIDGTVPPISEFLARNLDMTTDWIELPRLVPVREPIPRTAQFRCLAAIGGALRVEEEVL